MNGPKRDTVSANLKNTVQGGSDLLSSWATLNNGGVLLLPESNLCGCRWRLLFRKDPRIVRATKKAAESGVSLGAFCHEIFDTIPSKLSTLEPLR